MPIQSGTHIRKNITALENVQRRATKLIPGFKDMTYENRLRKLKLPTLAYRRKRGDMIEAFKLTSGLYDTALPSLLEIQKNTRTRGHSKKLYQHRSNKDIRKNFFTNRIINIWNSLPENVISAKNTKIFEHRLDNYWNDQDLLYNYESNLTTGEEIEIDEEKELSIVVDGQRSETDL